MNLTHSFVSQKHRSVDRLKRWIRYFYKIGTCIYQFYPWILEKWFSISEHYGYYSKDKMGGVYARRVNLPSSASCDSFACWNILFAIAAHFRVFITLYILYHLYFDLKSTVVLMWYYYARIESCWRRRNNAFICIYSSGKVHSYSVLDMTFRLFFLYLPNKWDHSC